jgi:NAD+ synthase (glutamine-hydrolysing)
MKLVGCTARKSTSAQAACRCCRIWNIRTRRQPQYDITFENVQAGERTNHLFRLANHHNAIVCGTGDLSELALGWCTYGVGDHVVALQRQRQRAEDADLAPGALGGRIRA